MLWGMTSSGWLTCLVNEAPDPKRAQLELMAEHGLHVTAWRASQLMEMKADRRAELAELAEELDIRIGLGVRIPIYAEDPAEREAATERAIEAVDELAPVFRSPLCESGLPYDSFTREPSIEEQIERASDALAPLAEHAAEAGCPLGLHNAGHWCRHLAELCHRTPGLGILLDTANPFFAAEQPFRAAQDAAPYVVGTHFKDRCGHPDSGRLVFETSGAVIGQGDVDIPTVFGILKDNVPDFENCPMLMEIDPVEGMEAREVLALSAEYVKSLG
ncbi:MAG: TIM barrel protein [Candidatus Brocadiia bacterium]